MTPIISEARRKERRRLILTAATDVFIEKGYNATTVQDIIERSGVSRGGIYTYFENTEDIFLSLLEERDKADALDVDALCAGRTSREALEFLLDAVATAIEEQHDPLVPALYEYYFTTGWRSKRHVPGLYLRIEKAVDAVASILERGIASGELPPGLATESIARMVITFCDGIYVNRLQLGPGRIELRKQFDAFRTLLSHTLTLNPAEDLS
ncbi:TetR/AcrR family transcriptional regulator [Exiguobacterium flavidum]|uniref:TetR/AcrR family transcriptional regulator n=1 Tax=Exiguobacterium flavidum TaxID=2184695 RepID=UPI000DF7C0FB|nr:TetR family transcriptional regulator [Exiguobacterium flavidum]